MNSLALVAFSKLLNIVGLLTYLVPLGVGLRRWRRLQPAYRPLVGFVLVPGTLLNGLLSEFGRYVQHNNIAYLQLALLGETLFLSWAYYNSFRSVAARRLLVLALGIFLGIYAFEMLYLNDVPNFNHIVYSHITQSILLVGAAVVYFEQTLRELRNIDLSQDSMFMVSVGSMLYYAGTLMVFVLEGQLQDQPDTIWIIYIIQSVMLMVFNGFLTLALWHGHRPVEPPEPLDSWPFLHP